MIIFGSVWTFTNSALHFNEFSADDFKCKAKVQGPHIYVYIALSSNIIVENESCGLLIFIQL